MTFAPARGERWALLGRNASGKTTLLKRMALGFAGSEAAQSDARSEVRFLQSDCAYMPQHHTDSFALPVADWVLLHASGMDAKRSLQRMASELDIAHLLARPVTELSGGERQRVGLAAVAIQTRPVWLLDEPISAQDPAHQALIGRWLAAQTGITIVFAAHDVQWVNLVATHVFAFLENGEQAQGTAAQMLTSQKLEAIFGCLMTAPILS